VGLSCRNPKRIICQIDTPNITTIKTCNAIFDTSRKTESNLIIVKFGLTFFCALADRMWLGVQGFT
jgi:hypothetical protein